jgi:hypothetical protein
MLDVEFANKCVIKIMQHNWANESGFVFVWKQNKYPVFEIQFEA